MTGPAAAVVAELVDRLDALPALARVAVDGVDCSGKTTLADAVAVAARRPVVRAGIDGFHRPRAQRYARGPLDPEGCYRDTYDLDALRRELLGPFAAGRPVRTRVFDHVTDRSLDEPAVPSPPDAVLVVDGVFLQRPELAGTWDLVVLLVVPDEEVLRRAARRDGPDAVARYRSRYLPAQRLYEAEVDPAAHADLVVGWAGDRWPPQDGRSGGPTSKRCDTGENR